MATRREVEAAVAGHDSTSYLIVCSGDGKCLASRPGSGHSANLIVLDLAEQIEGGAHFAVRPEMPDSIRKALKKRAKAERAKNRKASKRKQAASPPREGTSSPSRSLSRRPASPEPPAKPEPTEPPAEFRGIEVI